VRGLTRLLEEEWSPDAGQIIFELSNEVWNAAFPQGMLAQEDCPGCPGMAYGEQASEVFQLVVDEAVNDGQFSLVLMGNSNDPGYILDALAAYTGPDLTGIGCAAYVKPTPGGNYQSAEEVVDAMLENEQRILDAVQEHVEIADSMGLDLYIYEAGPSLVPTNPSESQYFPLAVLEPAMKEAMLEYLTALIEMGVDLVCPYNYIQMSDSFGNWGWWLDHETPTAMGQAWLEWSR